MKKSCAIAGALAGLAGLALGATEAAAQNARCVEGPITIVVPRSPGGGLDLLGRMVGAEWAKTLGADVVIENVEGAGGAIGLAQAFRAPADGTTIVSWSPPGEYILQLQGRLQFTVDDWEMIGATNSDPGTIAVPSDSSYKSVNDVIDASKNGSRRLASGTVGRTTISALESMLYQNLFSVKWGLVPFDGGGDLATAVLGGHVDLAVREGGFYDLHPSKLRILAVANETRINELPDVPTVEEATGKKVIYAAYRGFAVKKGTPPEVVACLRETFNEAAKSPAIVENQFKQIGFRYEFLDAEAFKAADKRLDAFADEFKNQILGTE